MDFILITGLELWVLLYRPFVFCEVIFEARQVERWIGKARVEGGRVWVWVFCP